MKWRKILKDKIQFTYIHVSSLKNNILVDTMIVKQKKYVGFSQVKKCTFVIQFLTYHYLNKCYLLYRLLADYPPRVDGVGTL